MTAKTIFNIKSNPRALYHRLKMREAFTYAAATLIAEGPLLFKDAGWGWKQYLIAGCVGVMTVRSLIEAANQRKKYVNALDPDAPEPEPEDGEEQPKNYWEKYLRARASLFGFGAISGAVMTAGYTALIVSAPHLLDPLSATCAFGLAAAGVASFQKYRHFKAAADMVAENPPVPAIG